MAKGLSVVGIALRDREDRSPKVQAVLSEFGGEILMRAGVPSGDRRRGMITLTVESGEERLRELVHELEEIDGVEIQTMHFP